MRRTLWNIYAWPVTIFILLGSLFELSALNALSAVDVALSIPALIALHLHVWDVRFLSSTFWKPYAFVYLGWDLCYNLVLNPTEMYSLAFLVLPVIALPLYVAVFRYAFRRWDMQPS